jgi:hypothetical protein
MKDEENNLTMDDLILKPYRGLVKAVFEGGSERIAAVWNRDGYENLRAAIYDAVCFYEDKTNIRAEYVFVKALPKGVDNGFEVGNVIILQADWVAPKYLFVCARTRG